MASVARKFESEAAAAGALADPASPNAAGCPIDLVHLARQTLGDRALEMDLLRLFERQSLHISRQIALAPVDALDRLTGDLAHTLVGSARAVGAGRVAAAAKACEAAPGSLPARVELAQAVDEARAAIADLLADR